MEVFDGTIISDAFHPSALFTCNDNHWFDDFFPENYLFVNCFLFQSVILSINDRRWWYFFSRINLCKHYRSFFNFKKAPKTSSKY